MSFERGWLSLHQMLATRPGGNVGEGALTRCTIDVPVQSRVHLPVIYKFKSKAAGDVIMLGPNGDQMLRIIGREPAAKGIIEVEHMAAAIDALHAAVRAGRHRPKPMHR